MEITGPRTACGVLNEDLASAIISARRRRDAAVIEAHRLSDAARAYALSGLASVWSDAEETWTQYLASDPAVGESTVIEAFERVAPACAVFFGLGR